MSQVLLVGVDGSECSHRSLDYAIDLAKSSGAAMVVLHVIEWSPYSFNTPSENEERHKRREEEIARAQSEIVQPVVQRLTDEGVESKGMVRHGHAAQSLKDVADELGATTIVIGRTGSSKIKAQLFGSVAGTLVQISNQPVTVVP